MKRCIICKKEIHGRTDKKFCSVKCKNNYHTRLRKSTDLAVKEINKILHRNRSILLEIFGRNKTQITVDRLILENKNFNFTYHTHCRTNSKGKLYQYVYDFAWMSFSKDTVLIIRLQNYRDY